MTYLIKILEAYAKCIFLDSSKKILLLNSFHSTQIFNDQILKISCDYKVSYKKSYYFQNDVFIINSIIKKFQNYDEIFGFVNENGNHWTLFYANSKKSEYSYIDPIGEFEENEKTSFRNWG